MKWLKRLIQSERSQSSSISITKEQQIIVERLIEKQSWGLIRNEYFKAAQRCAERGQIESAYVLYFLVTFLDCNGATNIEMKDGDIAKLGFLRWDTEFAALNKNVAARLAHLTGQLGGLTPQLESKCVLECEKRVIRRSPTKPPFSPKQVWDKLQAFK